jgi:hypothetical protein
MILAGVRLEQAMGSTHRGLGGSVTPLHFLYYEVLNEQRLLVGGKISTT